MGVLWAMSVPGLVCLLVVIVALERFGRCASRTSWLPWRRRSGLPVSAAAFDSFDSVFTDRRAEFEQRATQSMWRDDQAQGAPPAIRMDLANGRAWLPRRPVD